VERCCGKPCEETLCKACIIKRPTKHQMHRCYDHGLITEPIPDHSQIFGGKWYEDRVKKWGVPAEEDLEYAREAQEEARKPKVISILLDMPKKEVKKPRVSSKAKEELKELRDSLASEKVKVKPKTKAKAKVKAKENPYEIKEDKELERVFPEFQEQLETFDIDGYELEWVKLNTIQIGTTIYYVDQKQKLYSKDRRYIGRYDPIKEEIHTEISDSDEE